MTKTLIKTPNLREMSQPEASPKSILFLFFLLFRLVLEDKKPVKPGPAELKTIWLESKEIAGI